MAEQNQDRYSAYRHTNAAGINGLQLLEKIRNSWPLCRVIFLTGYNEFDYVYTAIKYDGVDYILKTEGYGEVAKAVERAIADIERSLKDEELISRAKQQMGMMAPLLQKEFLTDLLQGEISSCEIRQERFDELHIPLLVEYPVLLLMGRFDNLPKNISSAERSQYFFAIRLIMEQYLSAAVTNVCVECEHSSMFWLIQPGSFDVNEWEHSVLFVKGMLETIQAASRESLKMTVSFVFDTGSWGEIADRFTTLKQVFNYRIRTGTEIILTGKNLSCEEPEQCIAQNSPIRQAHAKLKKLGALENYLERGQENEFFKLLTELTEGLKEIASMNYNPALEIFYSIAMLFLSHINRWNLTERIAFKIGLNKLTRADEHGSWNDALEYLYRLSGIIFEFQYSEQEKRSMDAIAHIRQYIHEHLHDDLSLVKLAELVYLNPSYLSRLFKQVTGINLLNYINDDRLDKAKELLQKNNLKINEISASLGFISAPSFTRFFKKMTGITPQEYRKSLINR